MSFYLNVTKYKLNEKKLSRQEKCLAFRPCPLS